MNEELLNLLPPERLRAWKRDYFIRLGTSALYLLTLVVVGGGALLVPSYLYLHQEIALHQKESLALDAELATDKGQQTSKQLAGITNSITYLSRLATTTPASGAIRAVLSAPRSGVVLSGISFSPPLTGPNGSMILTGIAATRESLQNYSQELQALPYISSVDLPISSFAKDSSIPFTITLSGTLRP
jgi:hypothetical protein